MYIYPIIRRVYLFLFGNPNRVAFYTFILIAVAYFQLRSIKKTSRADFIKKFNDGFFTPETRNLLLLLLNSAIEFSVLDIEIAGSRNDRLPYFKIKTEVLDQLANAGLISIEPWRKGYNAFEIDDLILGHFDDVGRFERQGLLDIDTAYDTLGYYFIELLAEGEPVKSIVDDEDNVGSYDDLEYIRSEFLSYKSMKDKSCCFRFIWRSKHWIKRKIL